MRRRYSAVLLLVEFIYYDKARETKTIYLIYIFYKLIVLYLKVFNQLSFIYFLQVCTKIKKIGTLLVHVSTQNVDSLWSLFSVVVEVIVE